MRLARLFEREGHIDFFNAHLRPHGHRPGAGRAQHARHVAADRAVPAASSARSSARSKLPVFHAARIQDIATARYAIAEGLLDMVAMTRAHMADPQIVNKLVRGEEERIRPCVGASYCMYKKVACLHNPATGREQIACRRSSNAPAAPGRKVVVVGGGPAGLEAARVCRRAWPLRRAVRGGGQARRPDADRGARHLAARPDRHRRLACRRNWSGWAWMCG